MLKKNILTLLILISSVSCVAYRSNYNPIEPPKLSFDSFKDLKKNDVKVYLNIDLNIYAKSTLIKQNNTAFKKKQREFIQKLDLFQITDNPKDANYVINMIFTEKKEGSYISGFLSFLTLYIIPTITESKLDYEIEIFKKGSLIKKYHTYEGVYMISQLLLLPIVPFTIYHMNKITENRQFELWMQIKNDHILN